MRLSITTQHSANPFHAQQSCIGGRNPTRALSLHNSGVLTVVCQLSGSCLAHYRIVHTREILMGEGNKQPLLCLLPIWVVEYGLVAESYQHNLSTP